MLLVGRVASLGLNLVSQVLVVRYLSKGDYGVFAYGLSIVGFLRLVVSLGQERSVTRFLSIYDEQGRVDRMRGVAALYLLTVVVIGALCVGVVAVLAEPLASSLQNEAAAAVFVVLVLIAPIDAVDKLLEGTFAVFSRPRSIFFRKYLLQPVVKLGVIGLMVLTSSSVLFLAAGHVFAGVLGLVLYGWKLPDLLRRRRLWGAGVGRGVDIPVREILWFSVPLLTTELAVLSMNTVSVVLLGHFEDAEAVAAYRSVFPAARVNQLAVFSFSLLFLPLASRLFARGDGPGLRDAYWRTAAWLAVLTFPVFAITVPLAADTTVLLFGERYASSAPYLVLLSLGFYANAAVGFNQQTLQVYGRIRWVVAVNVGTAVLNIGLSLALIPLYGALGVALANAVALVTQNLGNQVGLARHTPAGAFDLRYRALYGTIALGALGLGALQWFFDPPLVVGLVAAGAIWAGLIRWSRHALRLAETFPELRRVPVVGTWLA